ncbi:Ubiquitin fusion degradation protein 4, partial [Blyttiomyces sp. JEL0837]
MSHSPQSSLPKHLLHSSSPSKRNSQSSTSEESSSITTSKKSAKRIRFDNNNVSQVSETSQDQERQQQQHQQATKSKRGKANLQHQQQDSIATQANSDNNQNQNRSRRAAAVKASAKITDIAVAGKKRKSIDPSTEDETTATTTGQQAASNTTSPTFTSTPSRKKKMGKSKGKQRLSKDADDDSEMTMDAGNVTNTTTKSSPSSSRKKATPTKKQQQQPSSSQSSTTVSTRSKRNRGSDATSALTGALTSKPSHDEDGDDYARDDDDDDDMNDDDDDYGDGGGRDYGGAATGGAGIGGLISGGSQGFFESLFAGAGGGGGSRGAVAASGNSRFKALLAQLQGGNATMQLVALQELAEILSVATEDMFTGSGGNRLYGFDTEEFTKALVGILRGTGDEFPVDMDFMDFDDGGDGGAFGFGGGAMKADLVLLACRCLSNLLEANPTSVSSLIANGGVAVLVSKLTSIEYIDLAEQVVTVLEKVSNDQYGAVLKANGLVASLQYIDFFGLHVQRTAVTIAANCCRGLNAVAPLGISGTPDAGKTNEILSMVKEVVPVLNRLLQYSDTKLVEQTIRCVSRIVDWCYKSETHLESLVSSELLSSIVSLISPTLSSSAVGSGDPVLFTPLVKILANVCKGSAKLTIELIKEKNIIDILYGYLTNGGQGSGSWAEDVQRLSTAVMTVIVNRPSDQVLEVLTLLCELLPTLPKSALWSTKMVPEEKKEAVLEVVAAGGSAASGSQRSGRAKKKGSSSDKGQGSGSGSGTEAAVSAAVASVSGAFERRFFRSSSPTKASASSTTTAAPVEAESTNGKKLTMLKDHRDSVTQYAVKFIPVLVEVFGAS